MSTVPRFDFFEVTRFGGPVEFVCVERPVLVHGFERIADNAQPWKCQSCGGPNDTGAKCQYCGGIAERKAPESMSRSEAIEIVERVVRGWL